MPGPQTKNKIFWLFKSGIICALISIALLSCRSMTKPKYEDAYKYAYGFLKAFSGSSKEAQQKFEMRESRIFGFPAMLYSLSLGTPIPEKVSTDPLLVKVKLRFWCKGKDIKGKNIKRRRELDVYLKKSTDYSKWDFDHYEMIMDSPLTLTRQLLWWVLLWLTGPFFLRLMLNLFLRPFNKHLAGLVNLFLIFPLLGYITYVLFSSVISVLIVVGGYFFLIFTSAAIVAKKSVATN